MNTTEFNGGHLTLSQEFSYMCTSIIRLPHGKLWNNSLADFLPPEYIVPISLAVIATSMVLAFSRSAFLSAFTSLSWNALCYPLNVALTWVLVKTGLYVPSRGLAAMASSLKRRRKNKTDTMKANVKRKKMNLKKVVYQARDCEETPRLGVYPDHDVEWGQGSGSQVCIVR
jgi:hypothetical protein